MHITSMVPNLSLGLEGKLSLTLVQNLTMSFPTLPRRTTPNFYRKLRSTPMQISTMLAAMQLFRLSMLKSRVPSLLSMGRTRFYLRTLVTMAMNFAWVEFRMVVTRPVLKPNTCYTFVFVLHLFILSNESIKADSSPHNVVVTFNVQTNKVTLRQCLVLTPGCCIEGVRGMRRCLK